MKNKEKKKYIFILSFLAVTVIFISWTLFKFYSVTHKRIYDMKIEEMKNLSMQGSAVVEKRKKILQTAPIWKNCSIFWRKEM